MIISIVFIVVSGIFVYPIGMPMIKDVPSLLTNRYSYTVGTVRYIKLGKRENTISINNLELYERKITFSAGLEHGKKY